LVEVGRHINIEILTLTEVTGISGREGNFEVELVQHPRYVDTEKCIACGLCAEKCPKRVTDEYNEAFGKRRSIYVPYSQAVPLKYAIDPQNCIYLIKNKCRFCEEVCPTGAINFQDTEKELSLNVGSVVLSTGFNHFDPAKLDYLGYNQHPDIVTSMGFERLLSATGPYGGHLRLPSDKKKEKEPKKIAWLQCVGSRDENRCNNGYCSSVCCMYAVKQAVMAKDHAKSPLDCAIFYMDMRTQGKDFDKYLENAKENGVRFIRSRVHSIIPNREKEGLLMRYADEEGNIRDELFDMVVLSTGLEIGDDSVKLAKRLGIELDSSNFIKTESFNPVSTSVPGLYGCGVFTGPKDIPQSVMEASAAAAAATEKLALARNTKTKKIDLPKERDVSRESPKIGVFVCNCGTNIGGIIDVPEVAGYVKTLPGVVYVEENLFTCSQDTQDKMAEVIKEKGLNRVVIAACTPKTHEDLFRETLVSAGLNKYLVEMANIRNQNSWVHADNPESATKKAKDMVRMAVAKSFLLKPLFESKLSVTRTALVVGGGIAGMTAALALARQGYPVSVVEKNQNLGGNGRLLHSTYLNEDVEANVKKLIGDVEENNLISLYLGSRIKTVEGFVGNFHTIVANGEKKNEISHGVAILATGAKESKPNEYLYGEHDSVMTHLDLDYRFINDAVEIGNANNIVFIQCVGSREEEHPYCSKVCCTHSIQSAIKIKKMNPNAGVFILYRDIRTYGKREFLYKEARDLGILFFKYNKDCMPTVIPGDDYVTVEFKDHILGKRLVVQADILCLASRIEANDQTVLSQAFKVASDKDGWFLEAHQKLRPVDFAVDGVFVCGMAHYPKPVDESVSQAKAAASRALTTLARETINVGGTISKINPELCSGCEGCIEVCPYGAIIFDDEKGVPKVNEALCKGCGACAAACPSEAASLMGFNNEQLYAQIKSAMTA
jgi:heterodisulfide reductase subunit A2